MFFPPKNNPFFDIVMGRHQENAAARFGFEKPALDNSKAGFLHDMLFFCRHMLATGRKRKI